MKATLLVAVLVLCSCRPEELVRSGNDAIFVRFNHSSTLNPITNSIAAEFAKEHPNVHVQFANGLGGGLQKFCSGDIDVANSSRPIRRDEIVACEQKGIEFIEEPVAYDAVVVAVNPQNTWADYLTITELKTLWGIDAQAKITKWSQIRKGWPDREIHLFSPSMDSGTYDFFTRAVTGLAGVARGDSSAIDDTDVLAKGVSLDPLALSFFSLVGYEGYKDVLRVVPIDSQDPKHPAGPVMPTNTTVSDGTYQPLSRPLFIYVKVQSLAVPEIAAFLDFYVKHATTVVAPAHYLPLPERVYELASERLRKRITGTMFDGTGAHIGVRPEELVDRQSQQIVRASEHTR